VKSFERIFFIKTLQSVLNESLDKISHTHACCLISSRSKMINSV